MKENQPPLLKRGLFGYTRPSVRRMLGDRDSMFALARARLNETQARVGQLEAQLTTLEQHLNLRNAEVESAAQQIAQLELELDGAREQLRESESLARDLSEARESLARDLSEARESLARMNVLALELTEARGRVEELDRDLGQARQQLREQEQRAESRIAAVETQLAGTRSELEQRARTAEVRATRAEAELAAARAELSSKPEAPSPVDASAQISAVLQASERAATRIIELATKAHQEQAEQMDRMRDELRQEVDRLATWRHQLGPIVGSIRSSIDRARSKIDDIPDRIRDALSPLGEAIDSVNDQLTALVDEAGEPAPEDDTGGEPQAATDEEQGPESERPEESASPIRAIHLGEPETSGAGETYESPRDRPGWRP